MKDSSLDALTAGGAAFICGFIFGSANTGLGTNS